MHIVSIPSTAEGIPEQEQGVSTRQAPVRYRRITRNIWS
jgi:hypothetical protein